MSFTETDCGPPPQEMHATITSPLVPTTVGSTVAYQCEEGYALNTTDDQKEFKYTRHCNLTNPALNLPGPVKWLESPMHCEGNLLFQITLYLFYGDQNQNYTLFITLSFCAHPYVYLTCNYNQNTHFTVLNCGVPTCRKHTIIITKDNNVNDTANLLCTEDSQYPDKTYDKNIMCELTEIGETRSVSWTNITESCECT